MAHWLFIFAIGGQQTLIADERDIGDVVKALRKSPPNLLALTGSLLTLGPLSTPAQAAYAAPDAIAVPGAVDVHDPDRLPVARVVPSM